MIFKIKRAFSLIELSIVILIIGILVAAIVKGQGLLANIKLAAAQSLTASSPVNGINNLTFWYETSNPDSFIGNENTDGSFITKWLDRNPQSSYKNDGYGGQNSSSDNFYYTIATGNVSGPEYIQDGIGGLPTLRFDNSGDNYRYVVVDPKGSNQPNKSFIMFMVFRYNGGSGYILDRSCVNASGHNVSCSSSVTLGRPLLNIRVDDGNLQLWLRSLDNQSTGLVNVGKSLASGETLIIALERKYSNRMVMYINGQEAPNDIAESFGPIALDPFKIGIHAQSNEEINTDISEVIFFSDKISSTRIDAIEDYLG